MSAADKYKNPKLTVDILIELDHAPGQLVFIERKNPPLGLALPGGFVDEGEFVADAAVREAKEETGLDIELVELFHVYSDPARDPRGHSVAIVYVATASGEPVAGDDAAAVIVTDPDQSPPLIFDHGKILADYIARRRGAARIAG